MSLEMIIVLVLIIVMHVCLVLDITRSGMIIFSELVVLLVSGILTPKEALSGFSNEGMLVTLFIHSGDTIDP